MSISSASRRTICRSSKVNVRLSHNIAYVLPYLCVIFLYTPITILQGIYVKYYGFSLATIALVILGARVFDAISDPLIGYFSDTYFAKTGTRKPFLVVGGILFSVSGYFLYSPPENVGVSYFAFWFISFYLGWTLFEIPHLTWGGELSSDAAEKAKTYSFRNGAAYLGLVLFYMVPLLPLFESSEITPETLHWSAVGAGFLLLPSLYICIKKVPNGDSNNSGRSELIAALNERKSIWALLYEISHNPPLLIFLLVTLCLFVSQGLWYGLIFIYVDIYLGMGEQFSGMFLFAFGVGLAVTPVWYKIAVHWGKKITLYSAMALYISSLIYTGYLEPAQVSFLQLITLKTINTLGATCMGILFPTILSEIVDYGTLRFGVNRAASYFSTYTIIMKFSLALGGAMGLGIAGYFGFDADSSIFSEKTVFGLQLAISWLPSFFASIAMMLVYFMSISDQSHRIIMRRLNSRR